MERSVDLRQARQDKPHSAEQLDTLGQLGKFDHVSLRVLPFGAGAHPAMVSPFILLRFDTEPDNMDVVYLEHDTGALYLERPADIDRYTWIFTEISRQALGEQESADLIATVKPSL